MGPEASEHYSGEAGAEYHRAYRHVFEARVGYSLRVLEPYLSPGEAVLDFGCADGSLLAALPNPERLGVEVNEASREAAAARGLTVVASTAELEEGTVDLAYSSHVLEHTLRPLDELHGLRRVLKPGGRLVLLLPIDDWRAQRRWALPDVDHHLYGWTPQLIANLLAEAGFRVEEIRIEAHALPGRFTGRLSRLPEPIFELTCRATAVLRRRRQLVAVATA